MIKLDSMSRWRPLPKGDVLTIDGTEQYRRIRLNVNSPGLAPLYLVNGDGTLTFLATADRRDVIEFAVAGPVNLTTEADDVTVYSAENEPTFAIIENAEVFTEIADRRARNPDLERLMFMQQQAMDRRFAAMQHEMEMRVANAYDAAKRTVTHSDAPGTVAPAPVEGAGPSPDGAGAPANGGGAAQPATTAGGAGDGPAISNAGNAGS